MYVCAAVWGDCQLWWGLNLLYSVGELSAGCASMLLFVDRGGAGSAQSDESALIHVDGSGAGSAQSAEVVCGVGVFCL